MGELDYAKDCEFPDLDELYLTPEEEDLVIGAIPLDSLPSGPICPLCDGIAGHYSTCTFYVRRGNDGRQIQ